MASKIGTKVARHVIGKQAAAYEPADPRYENYTDANGKERQRERPMPAGLSKLEEKTLRKIRRRAHRLDKGMSLCGFRVGYTFFIGLIPVVGDIADFLLSYSLIIRPAKKCDIPALLQSKMVSTSLLATGVCMIPIVGDIFAYAILRPNSRNAHMFEAYLVERAATNASGVQVNEAAAGSAVEASKAWNFNWKTGAAKPSGASTGVEEGSAQTGNALAISNAQPSQQTQAVHSQTPIVEENGQARCTLCNKIFQSRDFAVKHVNTKHPERSSVV